MEISAVLAIVLSYLVGAIPFGVLIGKMRGVDVRAIGSGNTGATNVYRTLGPTAGSIVLFLDAAKGWAGTFIAHRLSEGNTSLIAVCAVVAVIGHTFSLFLRGGGGKGIATAFGAMLGLSPVIALTCAAVWALLIWMTKTVSIGSIAAATLAIVLPLLIETPLPFQIVMALMGALAIWKHKSNIARLKAGTEPKIGEKSESKSPVSAANSARW